MTAYAVSLQTHEIGIRMALGARRADILRMVLSTGLGLVMAGILIGLATSFVANRLLSSELWGVSPSDPWTFSAVVAVVVAWALRHVCCRRGAPRASIRSPLAVRIIVP